MQAQFFDGLKLAAAGSFTEAFRGIKYPDRDQSGQLMKSNPNKGARMRHQ